MNTLFWTGKLSVLMSLMMFANSILAWITGNSRNKVRMKERVKNGYEGKFSDHISRYDEFTEEFQTNR